MGSREYSRTFHLMHYSKIKEGSKKSLEEHLNNIFTKLQKAKVKRIMIAERPYYLNKEHIDYYAFI